MPENSISKHSVTGYMTLGILTLLLVGSGTVYLSSSSFPRTNNSPVIQAEKAESVPYPGEHVVIFLDDMRLELRNGTTTIANMGLVSKGKPGNYYETIGGAYENDYKIKRHFSSIGHVYLPWSVHIFGNYFVHGIPYYPDGKKVSSEYSGGCIRMEDADAKRVYDFVTRGMPIIVTGKDMNEFSPTATTTDTFLSMDMTRFMVATVSLEVLTQDDEITDNDGTATTRRKLLPRLLLTGDDSVSRIYGEARGDATFVDYMNKKARSIGLTNTSFASLTEPVTTTREDYARFMRYMQNYKSYLFDISSPMPEPSR